MSSDDNHQVTATLEEEHKEWLDELYPLPSLTEQLRASSLRGIEAAREDESSTTIEAENVQVIEENNGEVRQDNG